MGKNTGDYHTLRTIEFSKQPRLPLDKVCLSRNGHYKGIDSKHADLVLRSDDTSIKVTVLPLTYAGMYFLYHY